MRRAAAIGYVILLTGTVAWGAGGKSDNKGSDKPSGKTSDGGGSHGRFSDQDVEKAIDKAVKFLLSQQKKDGSWAHYAGSRSKQTAGPTALVTYALLEAGMNVQDKRIAKALEWLAGQECWMTYSLACRCSAWQAANRQTQGKFYKQLALDAAQLVASSNYGNHTYTALSAPQNGFDNSNSQFGLLGVWAAAMDGQEIPAQYWKAVMGHWEREQQSDGGWQYSPRHVGGSCGTMTVGGIASLFVCIDNLYAGEFVSCGRAFNYKPILRGLEWLDKNFAATTADVTRHAHGYYYLYGIERVGLASGFKYFGTQDWYKIGAGKLLAAQKGDGSWSSPKDLPAEPEDEAGDVPNEGKDSKKDGGKNNAKKAQAEPSEAEAWTVLAGPSPGKTPSGGGGGGKKKGHKGPTTPYFEKPGEWRKPDEPEVWEKDVTDTAFALLFLIRGRHPVLVNKLEYEGDWNNRPRDLASLTLWLSRTFEKTMNWQVVNLKVPVEDLHDAPILYIAGSKKPAFSDEDLKKLRMFILQGGCIFSVTECNGGAFSKGMAEVYAKLFPQYELTPLGESHELYQSHFNLRGKPALSVLSNGVRPLAIHTSEDLSKSWQLRRAISDNVAFETAANVYMYVTGGGTLRPRGTSLWPRKSSGKGGTAVQVVRLKHNGNCDPEPLAWERFAILMHNEADLDLKVGAPSPIASLDKTQARIAVMTGTNEFALSDGEKKSLKAFVEGGGTLVIDVAGGIRRKAEATGTFSPVGFAASAEKYIAEIFGERSLQPLASGVPVLKRGKDDLGDVQYRLSTRRRVPKLSGVNLRAVMVGKRPGVIYSEEDLTAGLLGLEAACIDGYKPDDAVRVLRALVANTGS